MTFYIGLIALTVQGGC